MLVDETRHATYGELLQAIRARATLLLDSCPPGAHVGVLLENGIETAVTYFACLTAGMVYVPLALQPPAVMTRILDRLSLRALVTQQDMATAVGGTEDVPRLLVEDGPTNARHAKFPPPDPGRTAHVLLTSGTESGMPKAVATDHVGSILSHRWRETLWPYDHAADVVGCNIFGIWDLVPALCSGIPVVMIADRTMRDPFRLAATIVGYGINRIMMTPSLLHACLACDEGVDALKRLKLLVVCGETLTVHVAHRAERALPGVRIANLYSLSECHDVAAGDVRPDARITSGRVADFAEVFVSDEGERNRLLPVGEAGRVLVGGEALAHGYVNEAQLTRQRFFDLDCATGRERVYDTGDRGILHGNGELEILGRCDSAVKVRGAWAEPDAVAEIVSLHPNVDQAYVIAQSERRGGERLLAFIVTGSAVDAGKLVRELPAFVASRAPASSVPSRFEVVNALPLNAAGKIDRRALESMLSAHTSGESDPQDELERQIGSAFRDVLEDRHVNPNDDFFAVGGDSLSVVELCGVLHDSTGRRVGVRDVYDHPTPRSLARALRLRRARTSSRAWRLPELADDVTASATPRDNVGMVVITGATGALGSALLAHLMQSTALSVKAIVRERSDAEANARLDNVLRSRGISHVAERVSAVAGDLARSCFGLTRERFANLAAETDAIVHLGASLDAFARFGDLEAVNVGGTHEALRLASESGATMHHLSSSTVFPLGSRQSWKEDALGLAFMDSLAPAFEASFPDGYSLSKFAAERLAWCARDRGVPVRVWRLPHVLGADAGSRLLETVRTFLATNALPEGDWSWQFVDEQSVCGRLADALERPLSSTPPVTHLAMRPLRAAEILRALNDMGIRPKVLPLPAFVSAATAAARNAPRVERSVSTFTQLAFEHGPRAALCLIDAKLDARHPSADPDPLFRSMLTRHVF